LAAVLGMVLFGLFGAVEPAAGQAKKKKVDQPPTPGGVSPATHSGIKLVEKTEFRQIINVAQECIRDAVILEKKGDGDGADRAWNEAATAIQTVLDHKEDFPVQVRQRDASGHESTRWVSIKYEANSLLGSMPKSGLDVYEVKFGARAKDLLDDAKS